MKNITEFKTAFLVCVSLMMVGCQSSPDVPEVSSDGMLLAESTYSTIAYSKEGANFSEYNKVLILPSQVAFKKNWKANYNRGQASLSGRINDKDIIKIKEDVAKLFDDVFTEEFSKNDKQMLVKEPGRGVLLIKPAIINF
jgi:hypothetical protein